MTTATHSSSLNDNRHEGQGTQNSISLTGCIGSDIDDLALGSVDLVLVRG